MSAQPCTHANDSNQEQQGNHTLVSAAPDVTAHATVQTAGQSPSTGEVALCEEVDTVAQLGQAAGSARARAAETDSTLDAAHYHGLLERVPGSWLHQLLKSLPKTSKVAVFATSRWLAKHVMEASSSVTLKLTLCSTQSLTPGQTETRRRVLTKLLSTQPMFQVQLYAAAWQPFPSSLADRITSLEVYPDGGRVESCVDWAAMPHLRTLYVRGAQFHEDNVYGLCRTVEAGQLQHLRTLHLPECTNLPHVDHLVSALGPQLKDVSTRCRALMEKLDQCAALQSCTIGCWSVPASVMQHLCEHPTLRHLTLRQCEEVEGDHSQRSCSWDTLTLDWLCVDDLARMPLAGVKQLHLRYAVHCNPGPDHTSQNKASFVLSQHVVEKALFTADCQQEFSLSFPCPAIAPMVERMEGVKVSKLLYTATHPSVLPLLYKVLPVSVKTLKFWMSSGFDFTQLWQGLPQHVTSMALVCCDGITGAGLCKLVRTAPSHVQSLELQARDSLEFASWEAAGFVAATPSHLKLTIY